MKLTLPNSADDLLIKDGKLLMRSISIYEILKRFSHILRLTNFTFEDFSAALLASDQSSLIAEVHIQLLRTLIREDRLQQTWLGPPDIRDSINIYLQITDHITWPATLKTYLSADYKANSSILDKLTNEYKNYPLDVGIEIKLDVLDHLCDQFLLSNTTREEIVNGANTSFKPETVCRSCSKPNKPLINCVNCPAIYHPQCSDPPLEAPPEGTAFLCPLCALNHITGVTDCLAEDERTGYLKRHEAIGVDKQGRRYWNIIRRVFVVDETEDDIRYYSNEEQLNELLSCLVENRDDKTLIASLERQANEIGRQMLTTESLYEDLLKEYRNENGTYSKVLGEDGSYKSYVNHYATSGFAYNKNQNPDRDVNRSLANKFCVSAINSFKWYGAIDGHSHVLSATIKSTIFKFESSLPSTFIHPCWTSKRSTWMRTVNNAQEPNEFAKALSLLEASIKPVLFKPAWYDSVSFTQLFRSTFAEREEMKKTDRQPRGFERRDWYIQDIELSYKLGTAVKFSSKLKPVKHQVWKQRGEEYRITGLNGWTWLSSNHRSRQTKNKLLNSKNLTNLGNSGKLKTPTTFNLMTAVNKDSPQQMVRKCIIAQPKLPPVHDFLTKRTKVRSILVLPDSELKRLARSGGMRETKSFSYTAKQNNYVWPYGTTPRPTFRTCWLYRNRCINTMQDVATQLRTIHASIRWDDLQTKPPASGQNVITTDESTITIQLLKKRDRLPYLNHSEYLIKKTVSPIETPTKYRKVSVKAAKPSARSGLRVRRQTEEDEPKGPTNEELWVSENQLELWELRLFDEKIERQNQILREKAIREENEKRRKMEEERRRAAEAERRKREEEQRRNGITLPSPTTPSTPRPVYIINLNTNQPRPSPSTPVLRYFRTEQGQIIRLPANYLQRGTPLILRHVGPGSSQTNTYIIRPQITNTNIVLNANNNASPSSSASSASGSIAVATTTPTVNLPASSTSAPTTVSNASPTSTSTSTEAKNVGEIN